MKKMVLVFIAAVSVSLCGCSIANRYAVGTTGRLLPVCAVSEEKDQPVKYESYLIREELVEEIERGYIFCLDTFFQEETFPASDERRLFRVHENNIVNLEIEISGLFSGAVRNADAKGGKIVVKLISSDGKCVYHFEKQGQDMMRNLSVKEQIPVTAGQWELRISFAQIGRESWPRLKIAAAYELPSEEDVRWLRRDRLRNPAGMYGR